ncbi:alkaline shock response membrane anchor protein AmaP [Nonomuraea africana]|uniref:Alkaline shock response membrane anchor protein AmaP n=1 Tax=Nonomuraea africana TaxID=46171 RepID=A0ABR9KLR6_9ACTN|nr:alkaline shock response membrane anchor protein AmaP [Nonomuraea africana]MBE1562959.1 hypothetical protein [Nonomuraea africana]
MRTGRANRLGLAILGLVCLVAGGLVLARGLRAFPQNWAPADEPLVNGPVQEFFTRFSPWVWWALAALAVILALIGLRWLVAQSRHETMGEVRVEGGPEGQTTVTSAAVAKAAAAELTAVPSVTSATATLAGDHDHPKVRLRLAADDRMPMSALRQELSTVTVPHMKLALGADRLPVIAKVSLERAAPPRRAVR